MATKIRLARHGTTKKPFYRIVVADSRKKRDGSFVENLGYYNPVSNPKQLVLNKERVEYWLKTGAIPTETVKNLIKHYEEKK